MYLSSNFHKFDVRPKYVQFNGSTNSYFSWLDGSFLIEVFIGYIVIWHSYKDDAYNGIFYGNDSLFKFNEINDTFMNDLSEYLSYRECMNGYC